MHVCKMITTLAGIYLLKTTIETPEQGVKYGANGFVPVSLLLTLNIFHYLF